MIQMNEPNINELIAQIQAKNAEAFATLYDNYAPTLFGITYNIIRDKAAAEDLLQDIFMKIWNHIDSYNPERGRLFTWLLIITRNTCKDYLRSKPYRNQQHTTRSDQRDTLDYMMDSEVIYQDESWDLQHILEGIDPKYREIIHWVYICGYTQEKVATMLNIPVGTVKNTQSKRTQAASGNLNDVARLFYPDGLFK